MTNRSWFTARVSAEDEAEIAIYDEIGLFGITAADFRDELKRLGPVAHINVHINSPGGNVFDGITIHNLLVRHKASITVTVDGIAASIASVVAMAGDAVVMPENSMMMIHDPAGVVVGTSKEMRDLAAALDKAKLSLVSAYANKSGMDREQIAELMSAETWLTAEEAVEFGFADSIEAPVKMAARFDLSKFKNAPAMAGSKRKEPIMAKTDPVTFEALTLDQLKAERPDLAEVYQAEVKAQLEADAEAVRIAAEEVAAAEAAKNAGTETPEQIEARVRADAMTKANARASEIAALCAKTGMTAKMPEFIASGKDVDAIARAILDERVATGGNDISNRHGGGNGDKPVFPSTTDIYAHYNKRAH